MNGSTAAILSLPLLWLLLVFVGFSVIGCAEERPANGEDDALRIVSLSPAVSRTLVDLGLGDSIVGRTPYCKLVDQAIPVAGDLFDADFETLVRLRPTHVLVQPPGSGLNPELPVQAEKRGWTLGMWRLNDIDDIRHLLRELPEVLAGEDGSVDTALVERASALEQDIDAVLNIAEGDPIYTGEVLLIVSLDPVTVFGTGTYLDDLLSNFGASNLITNRGYPMLSLEDVKRLDPPAILLIQPGVDPDEDVRHRLGPLGPMDLRAWRDNRVAVLHHPDALMPSSAIVGVAEQLHAILRQWDTVERGRESATQGQRTQETSVSQSICPSIPASLSLLQGVDVP